MKDTTHLIALQTRLAHEREYLAKCRDHTTAQAMRQTWISQIEREIAQEKEFIGYEEHISEHDMTDAELLAELMSIK